MTLGMAASSSTSGAMITAPTRCGADLGDEEGGADTQGVASSMARIDETTEP